MYALDIDMHTAQELAAINNADNVLRYLDAVVAKVVCTKDWTHVNVIIILPFTFNIYILIALLIFFGRWRWKIPKRQENSKRRQIRSLPS